MKRNLLSITKFAGALLLMLSVSFSVQAQFLRTSYFMEGFTNRIQLNPALQPTRGYVNIPVVGALNVSTSSNALGTQDIIDILDSNDDFLTNDKLFNNLKTDNHIDVSLNTDLISFGFYKGKNFWSFNLGLRTDINASIPKSMFEYMRQADSNAGWDDLNYDIQGQKLDVNAYTEVGLGYSRSVTDRLTVGGRLKFLVGVGNLKLDVKQISIQSNIPARWQDASVEDIEKYEASIKTDARLESSFKGMKLTYNQKPGEQNEPENIDDIEFDNFGIAGYGGAIDLGASYRLFKNLTLSASILDLGFISWSESSTLAAVANRNKTYDKDNYQEFNNLVGDGDLLLDFDLLGLHEEKAKARTTRLASTLVVGGEYVIFNNKLAVGVLSTTRFSQPKTISELTFSANFRPKSWFNGAVSYSVIQSVGKSFGLGLKLGPLMVGTDYMFFGNNTKNVNAYLGVSFPLGGKKKSVKSAEI